MYHLLLQLCLFVIFATNKAPLDECRDLEKTATNQMLEHKKINHLTISQKMREKQTRQFKEMDARAYLLSAAFPKAHIVVMGLFGQMSAESTLHRTPTDVENGASVSSGASDATGKTVVMDFANSVQEYAFYDVDSIASRLWYWKVVTDNKMLSKPGLNNFILWYLLKICFLYGKNNSK